MTVGSPGLERTTVGALRARYDALLFDAYGVLVDASGAHPNALTCIQDLIDAQYPFFVLTNDASRLPETSSDHYRSLGLPIDADQIITSGSLLAPHFATHGLVGARCVVLGTEDSCRYVERAGGRVVDAGQSFDAVVVCDEAGFPLLETLDAVLTGVTRRTDAGLPTPLILPNPDLYYPKGGDEVGVAAGGLAGLLEIVLAQRYPERADLRFTPLGKPFAPIFEAAVARAGTRRLALLGNQLATDIRGANDFGIDSVLVGTGLTRLDRAWRPGEPRPTWVMRDLGGAKE